MSIVKRTNIFNKSDIDKAHSIKDYPNGMYRGSKENLKKKLVEDIKVDPITIDMPKMEARFVRFESSPDGQHFYVVYEIVRS